MQFLSIISQWKWIFFLVVLRMESRTLTIRGKHSTLRYIPSYEKILFKRLIIFTFGIKVMCKMLENTLVCNCYLPHMWSVLHALAFSLTLALLELNKYCTIFYCLHFFH